MFRTERSARIASSIVIIPLCAVLDYLGGPIFAVAVLALAIGLTKEWVALALMGRPSNSFHYAIALCSVFPAFVIWHLWGDGSGGTPWSFVASVVVSAAIAAVLVFSGPARGQRDSRVLAVVGIVYIVIGSLAAVILRDLVDGFATITWLILVIVATDIGAYISGRTIGGAKLWPRVSPKKTWAGLLGGAFAAGIVGAFLGSAGPSAMIANGGIAFGLAVVAQGGDLLESTLKRRAGAKDSGRLIPGHGGVLDRLDGFLAATPVFLWYVLLTGHGPGGALAGLVP